MTIKTITHEQLTLQKAKIITSLIKIQKHKRFLDIFTKSKKAETEIVY